MERSKPNIVYFFFDEMRQDGLSCYNNLMKTPNIQELSSHGTVYDNCFCNSPLCVPSRASLITSTYPEDTGIYGNEALSCHFTMDQTPLTVMDVLESNGYKTANFGKIHVPQQLNRFQVCNTEGSEMNMGLTSDERNNLHRLKPHSELSFNVASIYPENKAYYPEQVTRNAINWMKNEKNPYFIRISYLQPHSPIILKKEFTRIYENQHFILQQNQNDELSNYEKTFGEICGFNTFTDEEKEIAIEYYYSLIAWADAEVGKVISFLKKTGDFENTIFIVNSDHGALRGECNGGLGKHTFNRASHAVPLIIADGASNTCRHDKRLCANIDIAPTLLGLLGIDIPSEFKGSDLGKSSPEEVFATIGYGEVTSTAFPMRNLGKLGPEKGWPRRSAIRQSHYRLDMNTRINGMRTDASDEDLFFVDTEKCPQENINMANYPEYQDVISELKSKLITHISNSKEVPSEWLAQSSSTKIDVQQ